MDNVATLPSATNAATEVFHIPELLELILLSLPSDTTHKEIGSMRTIYTAQTASRTWHELLQSSTPLRQKLYLLTPLSTRGSRSWSQQTLTPPAVPNPWTPNILLCQRSWGRSWPFETAYTRFIDEDLGPSKPRYWTFSLELSRAQYQRLPPAGPWRDQLVTIPPFTDFWYTRAFYEMGSVRGVLHLDYHGKKPKSQQKYRVHRPAGVTLGDLVDAYTHLFEMHSAAKFVMIESVRCVPAVQETGVVEEKPASTMSHYNQWKRSIMV